MKAPLIRKLEAELEELNHELRITLPAELKRAADYGDLSENAEYDAAKERKRMVESRISILQKRVSEILSINVDNIPADKVGLGSTVTLEDLETGDEVIYHFVFSEDVDPEKGKISLASPIGKGLMGRSIGDEVKIVTPKGGREFEVVDLLTYHDKKEADKG